MGKNFLSLIKTCRSVRAYKSESVPSKALDAVLEAGLTLLPTEDINLQPSLQLQAPNIGGRLHWAIRSKKPVSTQHANKTILFGQFVEKVESMQTNNKMGGCARWKTHLANVDTATLISMFLQYSYNLIDSAFVARLSENA